MKRVPTVFVKSLLAGIGAASVVAIAALALSPQPRAVRRMLHRHLASRT